MTAPERIQPAQHINDNKVKEDDVDLLSFVGERRRDKDGLPRRAVRPVRRVVAELLSGVVPAARIERDVPL